MSDETTPGPEEFDEHAATILTGEPLDAVPTEATLEIDPDTAPHDYRRHPAYELGLRDGKFKGLKLGREQVLDLLAGAFRIHVGEPDATELAEHVDAWLRARLPPV